MAVSIIGKALIVAWSFTLTNLGPTPSVVDLGPAPTDADYVPVELMVVGAQEKDSVGLTISLGTEQKSPTNIFESGKIIDNNMNQNLNGYFSYGMGGNSIVPADRDLYVQYSSSTAYPAADTPIRIDVLAYPAY